MKIFIITLISFSLTLAAGIQTAPAQFPNIKTPKVRVTVPKVHVPAINKTVTVFAPRHLNFHATPSSAIVGVTYNQDYRIRGATDWTGPHYEVFRTYRPQWHDRVWWDSNQKNVVLIGGGWYYWNAGYWYPAWGYDQTAAYYPYDGPIYVGSNPRPFDQVVWQGVNREDGIIVLCNLHFLSLARRYATRVIALKEGRLVFDGLPKEIGPERFKQIYGEEALEVEVA